MAKWMRVERTPRSVRSEQISELAHNVLAMIPGISDVHVLTETSTAAAMSYVSIGREPFDDIDRKLLDVDLVRTPPFENAPDPSSIGPTELMRNLPHFRMR